MEVEVEMQVGAYLDVVPPELQQGGQTSLHLAEELVEESQLSDSVLVQQGAQTWWGGDQTHLLQLQSLVLSLLT